MVATGGLPHNHGENPFVINFVQLLVPNYAPPNARAVASNIAHDAVKARQANAKALKDENWLTLALDGGESQGRKSIGSFCITNHQGITWTVRVPSITRLCYV